MNTLNFENFFIGAICFVFCFLIPVICGVFVTHGKDFDVITLSSDENFKSTFEYWKCGVKAILIVIAIFAAVVVCFSVIGFFVIQISKFLGKL